ncbi:P450 monooxygenase AflN [Colletotrichum higginsianum]|uniref:P450 monooxygenase AflN n=1 Tax=Colletotrichum higginsianum TaxID=80884 RepID=A0A4T0VUY5_9PEZI|nr:P450 monooxygenase AflN [Colletotrichum higginsianum]
MVSALGTDQKVWSAIIAAGVTGFIYFLAKLYAARKAIWRMQRANLPIPDFSFIGGHFPVLKSVMRVLPSDSIIHNIMWKISEDYPKGIFYISLWPFSGTVMVVADAEAASQLDALPLAKGIDIIVPLEKLEDLTLRMTFDIIGSVVLDTRLHHQKQDHPLALALRKQIEWTSFREPLNPLEKYLTIRPLILWLNGKKVDQFIFAETDRILSERFRDDPGPNDVTRSKSIASLFIDEYLKEVGGKESDNDAKQAIKNTITPQVRLFLFAGHDTTSSTLLYCYKLLSDNPDVLSRVVTEIRDTFGPDPSQVQNRIHEDPQLLNRTPYTVAFIKEVLRIYPPAGALRQGRSDVQVVDEDGRVYPTEGCNVWTLSLAIHHSPKHWKDPEACIPDRWLVGPEDPLYPPKGAWRPFEWGPRNCIGQTLAMLELRIALAMTVREFSLTPAYDEWDELHPKTGINTVNGNRAYQAIKGGGGAHPADGFPVKLALRAH